MNTGNPNTATIAMIATRIPPPALTLWKGKSLSSESNVKLADRPGGYTRIIKTGNRLGDNAEMCFIELVDYNENMAKEKVAKKATRTRRSKKAAATEATPAAETAAPVAEAPAAEEAKAE